MFDGDRSSYWHTPWKNGIPRHPHEIQIDLGAQQKFAGIRYLPAVINNNNGMIRDYELFVSNDGQSWGDPVAKGFLVSRVRVDRAHLAGGAILYETSERWQKQPRIYRYSMDGKPARLIRENARIVFLSGSYYVVTAKNAKNEDVLVVLRVDNDAYRFELGLTRQFHSQLMEITGDRLVLGQRGVLVADLASKRLIVGPTDAKLKHNQHGLVVLEGADNLLKIVHRGNQGHAIFRFDLRTGQQTEFVLADQLEPFQDRRQNKRQGAFQRCDGVILLNDKSAVTAWIPAVP